MILIDISEEYNLPVRFIIDFLKSKNIIKYTYDDLNHNEIKLIIESLVYLRNNSATWQEQQNLDELNRKNNILNILNKLKFPETNYKDDDANILNISNTLNIDNKIINKWLHDNGYINLYSNLSLAAFDELKSVFDKNNILKRDDFNFVCKENSVRKKTIYLTDNLFQKYGLKRYQDIINGIFFIEINGNLTRYDKDKIEVIIFEAIDVFLSHLNDGSFEQSTGKSYMKDDFEKIQNIIIYGKHNDEEFNIIKYLILDSLNFWHNYNIKNDYLTYKFYDGQKLLRKIEYCRDCDQRPCECHIINKENKEIAKFNKINYGERDYDENSQFCSACEHRPCICSDPERTSMTLNW
jgi:hypothetical protein